MSEQLTDTGQYEIYICDGCYIPCIFTRPPKDGEEYYTCWNGHCRIITNPQKLEECD